MKTTRRGILQFLGVSAPTAVMLYGKQHVYPVCGAKLPVPAGKETCSSGLNYAFSFEKTATWDIDYVTALCEKYGFVFKKFIRIPMRNEFNFTEIEIFPRASLNTQQAHAVYAGGGVYLPFGLCPLNHMAVDSFIEEIELAGFLLQEITTSQRQTEWAEIKIKYATFSAQVTAPRKS